MPETLPQPELHEPEFRFGEGRISGALGLFLGVVAFGGVLCFWFPSLLTSPEARALYAAHLGVFRAILETALVGAFFFGALSLAWSKSKKQGCTALLLALAAALMGGAQAKVGVVESRPFYFGVDYFLLELLALSLVFIPLERLFARIPTQKVLRADWWLDMKHFLIGHVGVQLVSFLIALPAHLFFKWAVSPAFQAKVAAQPFWLQVIELLFLIDFINYWIHVAFHKVPWLWKFHAVHHSPEHMDWLAGSRSHLVDTVANRALPYALIFLMGFAPGPLLVYISFVSFQAVFIHANVRWTFPGLRWVIATPEFHHWHHCKDAEGIDTNFAVFLPVYDWLFRTAHMPGYWPKDLGVSGETLPQTYLGQMAYPFKRGA
ncbi:MAG: sterol desaturase family protein [Acidobacteria bacterium]|nr:sterol desaturase family protein [Acidobacteriota bacterium]